MLAAFTVNSTADTVDANPGDGLAKDANGNTTLRAAVMEANASAGDDTIELPAGIFSLSIPGAGENIAATGDLDITDSTGSLTIIGVGGGNSVIDASLLGDRVFHAVNSSVDVSFEAVVITGGAVIGQGGGIYFNGDELAISDSSITANSASGPGGALRVSNGTITISGSHLSGNSAGNGGGAIAASGSLTIENSTISENTANNGGGIVFSAGVLNISDSVLSANKATAAAGIGIGNNGIATITNSVISDNVADSNDAGGISNGGQFTLHNSLVSGNATSDHGGGIYNRGTIAISDSSIIDNSAGVTASFGGGLFNRGSMTITMSTIAGNSATSGGGIFTSHDIDATLRVSNSTISTNSAGSGGGIFNRGTTTLSNVTLNGNVANASGGVFNEGFFGATFNFANTILADNVASNGPDQGNTAGANLNSQGFNLVGNNSGFVFAPSTGDLVGTATSPIDPLLGPLQDNGGPTFTHELLPGSPAIDAAGPTNSNGDPVTADQRGIARPQGAANDIGAFEVEVTNTPPVADAGEPYAVDEGSGITLDASASFDPDGDPLTYAWDLDGDGQFDDAAGVAPVLSWIALEAAGIADDGTYAVSVQVMDDSGAADTAESTITVSNVAPEIGPIAGPIDPVAVGSEVSVSAPFGDPGSADTHTAVWDWGDGSSTTVNPAMSPVASNHTYTTPGVYTITLTVTDDDGGTDVEIFQYAVVYDPSGGFVTGGGWIDSPAGAFADDPLLTGKANFGFVAKYKKGKSTPDGQTQFQFKAGDLNFHSTSYQWLVIAGPHAKFKGEGTINGQGNYGFMLTATDGQQNGGGGVDRFRIKIWDKDDGDTVVYDNQMGAADDSNDGTELGGGSIVIHSTNGNGARSAVSANVAGDEAASPKPAFNGNPAPGSFSKDVAALDGLLGKSETVFAASPQAYWSGLPAAGGTLSSPTFASSALERITAARSAAVDAWLGETKDDVTDLASGDAGRDDWFAEMGDDPMAVGLRSDGLLTA